MTPLIIIGSILLFIALFLTLPFHIEIRQEDSLLVTVRLLGVKLYRFDPNAPEKEKKPKKKGKKKKKPGDEKKPPDKKREKDKTKETLSLVFDLLGDAMRALGRLVKRLKIVRLRIRLTVAEGDAAETAVSYGKMCAYVYGGFATASNLIKIKNPDIKINADFTKEDYSFSLLCVVSVALWMPLVAAFRLLWALLKRTVARAKEDSVQAPEDSHNGRAEKTGEEQKEKVGS